MNPSMTKYKIDGVLFIKVNRGASFKISTDILFQVLKKKIRGSHERSARWDQAENKFALHTLRYLLCRVLLLFVRGPHANAIAMTKVGALLAHSGNRFMVEILGAYRSEHPWPSPPNHNLSIGAFRLAHRSLTSEET